jgi:hypothetical protein
VAGGGAEGDVPDAQASSKEKGDIEQRKGGHTGFFTDSMGSEPIRRYVPLYLRAMFELRNVRLSFRLDPQWSVHARNPVSVRLFGQE